MDAVLPITNVLLQTFVRSKSYRFFLSDSSLVFPRGVRDSLGVVSVLARLALATDVEKGGEKNQSFCCVDAGGRVISASPLCMWWAMLRGRLPFPALPARSDASVRFFFYLGREVMTLMSLGCWDAAGSFAADAAWCFSTGLLSVVDWELESLVRRYTALQADYFFVAVVLLESEPSVVRRLCLGLVFRVPHKSPRGVQVEVLDRAFAKACNST